MPDECAHVLVMVGQLGQDGSGPFRFGIQQGRRAGGRTPALRWSQPG